LPYAICNGARLRASRKDAPLVPLEEAVRATLIISCRGGHDQAPPFAISGMPASSYGGADASPPTAPRCCQYCTQPLRVLIAKNGGYTRITCA